jgi:hypothetical protein
VDKGAGQAHSGLVLSPASHSVDAAIAAAREVLARLCDVSNLVVLHDTNNVVVGTGAFVAKVTTNNAVAERERLLADHASAMGAPAFASVAPPAISRGFSILVWPQGARPSTVSRRDAALALRSVQRAWSRCGIALPTLAGRLEEARTLLRSGELDPVLDRHWATALDELIGQGIEAICDRSAIIHGEPHDGNFVLQGSRLMVIDFEAVCLGPIEWDAAFFPDEVVAEVWPESDAGLLAQLRAVVSATVSTYCWRHLAVRGDHTELRSHAEAHLARAISGHA